MDAPTTPAHDETSDGSRRSSALLIAVCVIILFLTVLAFLQPGRDDPTVEPTGLKWWTQPIEINALARLPLIDGDLNGVATTLDGKDVWVVGARGFILKSKDGGETWEQLPWSRVSADPRAPKAPEDLISVSLAGPDRAFVGLGGDVFMYAPNGVTWNTDWDLPRFERFAGSERPVTIALDSEVQPGGLAAAFSAQRAVMVGRGGSVSVAERTIQNDMKEDVKNAAAKAQGPPDTKSWRSVYTDVKENLRCVWISPDGNRAVACGDGATIIASEDPGTRWARASIGREKPPPSTLRSVAFDRDGRYGIAVGDGGVVLITRTSGRGWGTVSAGTDVDLRAVAMTGAGDTAWIVGTGGLLVKVDMRAGFNKVDVVKEDFAAAFHRKSWRTSADSGTYVKLPSPLACIGILLLLLPLVRLGRRPPPTVTRTKSVAALLVTDRPVEAGDRAVGDLDEAAAGVVRFLAHKRTEPPLVLAVTGPWGSGKSSLMNLIRARLREYAFPTVWFNAWHHQTEEHLAAALMKSLSRDAIPSPWTPTGLQFRLRLLQGRPWRMVVIFLVLIAAGFLLGDVVFGKSHLMPALTDALDLAAKGKDVDPEGKLRVFGISIGAIVAICLALKHALATFNLGSRLRALLTGAFSLSEVKEQTGFRQRFGERFREVTNALRPRKLAIFIDDLDRCEPERVARFLEVVNFLCTQGGCYVIIGTDLDYIRTAVGLGYREVAAELYPQEKTPFAARQDFAKAYLEKLINIEVSVPHSDFRAAQNMIKAAAHPDAGPKIPAPLAFLRAVRGLGWSVGAPALLIVALVGGVWAGRAVSNAIGSAPIGQTDALKGQESSGPASESKPERDPSPGASDPNALPKSTREVDFGAASGKRIEKWVYVIPVVLLLGMVGIFLRRRPKKLEIDSAKFENAVNAFVPCVHQNQRDPTPRSMKRFVNHARFVAMRQRRGEQPKPTKWQEFQMAIGVRERPTPPDPDAPRPPPLPERTIVALAAIEHTQQSALEAGAAGVAKAAVTTRCPEAFEGLNLDDATIDQYLRLSGGFRTGRNDTVEEKPRSPTSRPRPIEKPPERGLDS